MKAMSMPLDSFDRNNHKRPKWINNHLKKKKTNDDCMCN